MNHRDANNQVSSSKFLDQSNPSTVQNWPYLDNFLTKCYGILTYLDNLGSESPEYGEKVWGLVRKLSRYG